MNRYRPFTYSNGQPSRWARYRMEQVDSKIPDLFYLSLQYRVKTWYGYTWKAAARRFYLDTGNWNEYRTSKMRLQEQARERAEQRSQRKRFVVRMRKEVGHEA